MQSNVLSLESCRIAMEQLEVKGSPINGTDGDGNRANRRSNVIEEAIKAIQEDAKAKFCLGVKIYSGFGDQRFNLDGCPRHGCVVFRIKRKDGFKGEFNQGCCIYFLQAVRDFQPNSDTKLVNLATALIRLKELEKETALISGLIENTQYDFENIA